MKFNKDNAEEIENSEFVTAYKYGTTLEVSNAVGSDPIVVKYDRDHMVNRLTGEITAVDHCLDRSDPRLRKSLKSSFKRLKRLIGANFCKARRNSSLWITLTYAQPDGKPMTDQHRLYEDFRRFIQKLKRKLSPRELVYIVTMEPQGNGSFHAHLLIKTTDESYLYLKNDEVSRLWSQGFVNVRRVKNSDNVGAYLMAYLTDVDIANPDGDLKKMGQGKPKSVIKGGRLGFYPLHFNLYRASKNCRKPEKIRTTKKKLKEEFSIGNCKPDYFRKLEIRKKDSDPYEIKVEYYNLEKVRLEHTLERIHREK